MSGAVLLASTGRLQARPPAIPPGMLAKQEAVARSLALFAGDDPVAAERVLHAGNKHAVGTPENEYEDATNLILVITALANQGNQSQVATVARLAIGHLQNAAMGFQGRNQPDLVAHQYELIGMILEWHLGEYNAAAEYYAQAANLSTTARLAATRAAHIAEMNKLEKKRNAGVSSNR